MKKFNYFLVLLSSFFIISCGDINVLTPEVEPENRNWQLEHYIDFFQALTTDPVGSRFVYTYNPTSKELTIVNTIESDSKAEMKPYSAVTNAGKSIELTYRDESPTGSVSVNSRKNTKMTHRFTVQQVGKGTGAAIPVAIKYIFPNPALGSNVNEAKTISF